MEKELNFERRGFGRRLKSMLKVDFKRMFTTPLAYIMLGVSLVLPVLIFVMTTSMGAEGGESFTNVWQAIGSSGGASLDLTGMCNINLVYFLAAVLVCVFTADDFRSGYAKNLFSVRPQKTEYVVSKTIACFTGAAGMLLAYFLGAMIGGAIAGLSFDPGTAGAYGAAMCVVSKLFLAAMFVSIDLLMSVLAKQKLWLSLVLSLGAGMLLFTMIPMIAPLSATALNAVLCLAGGALFGAGLGAVSNIVLKKTDLV